jgi:hypothetical protein
MRTLSLTNAAIARTSVPLLPAEVVADTNDYGSFYRGKQCRFAIESPLNIAPTMPQKP